jgi:hypothetical protein
VLASLRRAVEPVMSIRPTGVALLLVLAVGCATATPTVAGPPAAVPEDPDRWARAACQRGEYPIELDARAFAQARMDDLTAERQGVRMPTATQRLLDQRSAFESRCAGWRRVVQVSL